MSAKISPVNDNQLLEKDYLSKALEHLNSNEYYSAISLLDNAIAINPNNKTSYEKKGLALNKLDKKEEALAAYEKAIELDPNMISALYEKGNILGDMGQDEAVISVYKKMVEIEPRNERAHQLIGSGLSKLEQRVAALVSKKTLETQPKKCRNHQQIGLNLREMGQIEASIVSYKKSLEINPEDSPTHQQIDKLGQIEASIASYRKAVEIDAWNFTGERLKELGRFKEAINAYDQVIKLNPKDKHAYTNKGFALYHQIGIEEAIKCYDKQIEITPSSWAAYFQKGRALEDLMKEREALENFKKGMDIINQGKLDGTNFYYPNADDGFEQVNTLEIELIVNIKELLSISDLPVTPTLDKTNIQGLNQVKEIIKIRFIKAAFTVQHESDKQKEFDKLKKDLGRLKTLFQKIELAQAKAVVQEKELPEIKRGFKALEEQDPELLAYCKTFYWTSMNLFGAYRAISAGLMQANFEAETNEKEELLVTGAKKAASLLAGVVRGEPIVGGTMKLFDNVIDGIYGAGKENVFNNKVAAINKTIEAKLGTEDEVSLNVSKAALAITAAREQAILYPELSSSNSTPTSAKIKAGLKWLSDKVNEIKDKFLPSIELHDKESTGAVLALQDVALFMVYICKNHESIIKGTEALDKQIVSIVKFNGLDQMLEERDDEKPETKSLEHTQRSHCCTMF